MTLRCIADGEATCTVSCKAFREGGDWCAPKTLCPECAQGKPQNCAGQALDEVTEDLVPCEGPS